MISDAELLRFHEEGFIPGPLEGNEEFLQRIFFTKKLYQDPKIFFEEIKEPPPFFLEARLKRPIWSWTRTRLWEMYEMAPEFVSAFFHNRGISFFQGAVTWIGKERVPVLQIRKGFEKGSFLWIYDLDEMLAHEGVHAARAAFDEPIFEEFFAYLTSSSRWRKVIGPMIRHSWEVFVFSIVVMGWMLSSFFDYNLLFLGFSSALLSWVGLGLFRLFRLRMIFFRTFRKLQKHFSCSKKALAMMVRLTDREIIEFSRFSLEEIKAVIEKDRSLRCRLISLLYKLGN
ncbi:MAG: hypothetical protein WCP39_01245 [Chlamydiota bacterium]